MNVNSYHQMFEDAERDPDYWLALPQTEFLEDVVRRMETQDVKRADLAEKLNSTRPWVTKLLRGDTNFTLRTMVKVAMVLGGSLHMHIADRNAVVRWKEYPPTAIAEIGEIAGHPIGTPVFSRNEQATQQTVDAAVNG